MTDGTDETGRRAIRAATEFIIENTDGEPSLTTEYDRAIIEMHVAGTLAWLVTRWRSEGEEVERLGKSFIAAALETTAHLEDLVRMDEDDDKSVSD